MLQALKNNKVLLWGVNIVPIDELEPFDHGNKNPRSIKQIGKTKKGKSESYDGEIIEESESDDEEIHERKVGEKYNPVVRYSNKDIPFLEKELKKIKSEIQKYENEMEETGDLDKIYELGDLVERKEVLVEDIEYSIKQASNIKKSDVKEIVQKPTKSKVKKGTGFLKGSLEAKEHAKKMRLARESKKAGIEPIKPAIVNISKSRVVKGSEEAKELGKKLSDAKKAKQTLKTQLIEDVKPQKKHVVKSPWYYIGDIPPRYREATMIEAIRNNKVSEYGKYQVDEIMYHMYKNYNILLSDELSDKMLLMERAGITKRIEKIDRQMDVLDGKADKEQDESKKAYILWEISELLVERKDIIKCYNWLTKQYHTRNKLPYKKEEFKKVIPKLSVIQKIKEKPIIVIKPKEKVIKPIKKTVKQLEEEYGEIYIKGNHEIKIKKESFDEDHKLKSKLAKELYEQGIMFDKNMYKLKDYKKFIYVSKNLQIDDILEDIKLDFKNIKKAKVIPKAKEPGEYESQLFKKRTKQEDIDYYASREQEAYKKALKEEEEENKKEKHNISQKELDEIFNSINPSPKKVETVVENPPKKVETVVEKPKKSSKEPVIEIKKTNTKKSMVITPEMETKYNLMEYTVLEDEFKDDDFMIDLINSSNKARAGQIIKLSKELGIKLIDPNI